MSEINKISYRELKDAFFKHECERANKLKEGVDIGSLRGCIVVSEDSFSESYPLDARTYVVSSDNKAFQPNMGGYSIYGSSLDGSDRFVRLEAYLAAERGSWKVDYCYMCDKSGKPL